MLYDIIDRDRVPHSLQDGHGPEEISSSKPIANASTSASYQLDLFLNRYPPNKNIYQTEQGAIDPRTTNISNTQNPSTSRTVEINSRSINNPLAPCGPSPFVAMWPSRIPRMFDPAARSKTLHNHVFGMLPEPAVARKLTKAYLKGPFHHGWPVGVF